MRLTAHHHINRAVSSCKKHDSPSSRSLARQPSRFPMSPDWAFVVLGAAGGKNAWTVRDGESEGARLDRGECRIGK